MNPPTFDNDIRPLFRAEDVEAMEWAFDLSAYDDVSEHAEEIHTRLADGSMPCDAPWSEENVERFGQWIEAGKPH